MHADVLGTKGFLVPIDQWEECSSSLAPFT